MPIPTTTTRKRQLPSHSRSSAVPRFHLTHRDRQIIARIWYYQLLTSAQIESLLFHSSSTSYRGLRTQCQRRLQLLFHHGYLTRVQQPLYLGEGRKPFIYKLDNRGYTVIRQQFNSPAGIQHRNRPKSKPADPYRLDHDLAVNDTWVMLDRLVQAGELAMPHWATSCHLKTDVYQNRLPVITVGGNPKRKIPDAYFAIQWDKSAQLAHFFYEEDRSTETRKQWLEKVHAYLVFRQSGASKRHFNCRNFRVLTKTTTPKRREHLHAWTQEAGGDAMFWFTTCDQFSIWRPYDFLNPIWNVASIQGTHAITAEDPSQLKHNVT